MYRKSLPMSLMLSVTWLVLGGTAAHAAVDEVTVRAVVETSLNRYGYEHESRIRRGVRQVADRWWPDDGSHPGFMNQC